jgi:hypothetical protein
MPGTVVAIESHQYLSLTRLLLQSASTLITLSATTRGGDTRQRRLEPSPQHYWPLHPHQLAASCRMQSQTMIEYMEQCQPPRESELHLEYNQSELRQESTDSSTIPPWHQRPLHAAVFGYRQRARNCPKILAPISLIVGPTLVPPDKPPHCLACKHLGIMSGPTSAAARSAFGHAVSYRFITSSLPPPSPVRQYRGLNRMLRHTLAA